MDNLKDEKNLVALILSLILGWSVLSLLIIPITFIHEALHLASAYLLNGVVKEVVFFNPQAWISNFIFPFNVNTFGYVIAQFPQGANTLLYYLMPYLILFPVGIGMAVASFIDDKYDFLMLIAGPILWSQYIFFWTDSSLALGFENVVQPPLLFNVFVFLTALAMVSYRSFSMLRRELNLEKMRKLPGGY